MKDSKHKCGDLWRLLVPDKEVLKMQSKETFIRTLVNIKQDDMKKVFHFNAKVYMTENVFKFELCNY